MGQVLIFDNPPVYTLPESDFYFPDTEEDFEELSEKIISLLKVRPVPRSVRVKIQ